MGIHAVENCWFITIPQKNAIYRAHLIKKLNVLVNGNKIERHYMKGYMYTPQLMVEA